MDPSQRSAGSSSLAPSPTLGSAGSAGSASAPAQSRYQHLTSRLASDAIHALDAASFPRSSTTAIQPGDVKGKRKRVEDVEIDIAKGEHALKGALFRKLTGLGSAARDKRRATPPSSHAQHYAPFSLPSLLSRLATYTLSTYSAKPRSVDALSAALHGWTNAGGRERLECAVCGASMRVEGWKGLKPEARDRLTAHFVRELNEAHRPSCPWRIRACDAGLYRVPLKAGTTTIAQLAPEARRLAPVVLQLRIEHPVPQEDVKVLVQRLSRVSSSWENGASRDAAAPVDALPEQAALLALFGWHLSELAAAPTPVSTNGTDGSASTSSDAASTSLVQCSMCLRKVGLWSFTSDSPAAPSSESNKSTRRFHLIREHRTFCPYVNGAVQAGLPASAPLPLPASSTTPSLAGSRAESPAPAPDTLVGMRSRAGSDASIASLASETRSTVSAMHAQNGATTTQEDLQMQPAWKILLNIALIKRGGAPRGLPSAERGGAGASQMMLPPSTPGSSPIKPTGSVHAPTGADAAAITTTTTTPATLAAKSKTAHLGHMRSDELLAYVRNAIGVSGAGSASGSASGPGSGSASASASASASGTRLSAGSGASAPASAPVPAPAPAPVPVTASVTAFATPAAPMPAPAPAPAPMLEQQQHEQQRARVL